MSGSTGNRKGGRGKEPSADELLPSNRRHASLPFLPPPPPLTSSRRSPTHARADLGWPAILLVASLFALPSLASPTLVCSRARAHRVGQA